MWQPVLLPLYRNKFHHLLKTRTSIQVCGNALFPRISDVPLSWLPLPFASWPPLICSRGNRWEAPVLSRWQHLLFPTCLQQLCDPWRKNDATTEWRPCKLTGWGRADGAKGDTIPFALLACLLPMYRGSRRFGEFPNIELCLLIIPQCVVFRGHRCGAS